MVTSMRMHWAYRGDVHASDRRLAVELAAAVNQLSSPIYFVAGDSIMALTWVDEVQPVSGGVRQRLYRMTPAQPPRPNTCAAAFLEWWPSGCSVSQTIHDERSASAIAASTREGAQASLECLLHTVRLRLWPESAGAELPRSA
jgi:hypothetical protein